MADKKKKVRSVKDTPRHKVGVVLGTGFFVILCAIIVFPVFAGLLASFRPGKELIRRGLSIDLDFSTMSLDNYTYLFSGNADSQKYFMWYKNSLIITIVSVVLTLLICYFVAYGLTMYNYRLKNFLFFLVIATMMVPFEILMLPLYKEIIAIGLIDSYVGVIITGLCSASTIFFFKQYLSGLPKDLLDAARIDGATEYGIATKLYSHSQSRHLLLWEYCQRWVCGMQSFGHCLYLKVQRSLHFLSDLILFSHHTETIMMYLLQARCLVFYRYLLSF